MARNFVIASSQYGNVASGISGPPATLACWARIASSAASQVVMALVNGSTGYRSQFYHLSGSGVTFNHVTSAGNFGATYTVLTAGTWYHLALTVSSSGGTDTCKLYVNGSLVYSFTATTGTTSWNTLYFGARWNGSVGLYLGGDIAFPGEWSEALGADDVAALANAFAPPLVRLQSLVDAWPFHGRVSPEPGIRGSAVTLFNSPAQADSPRIMV